MVGMNKRFPGAAGYALFPGAAEQQQTIFTFQKYTENLHDGRGNNVRGLKTQTAPHSNNHPQVPIFHAQSHPSNWSTVANCVDNGLPHAEKYGNGLEYHHIPNRMNYGYKKKPFWRVKSLDDDDE